MRSATSSPVPPEADRARNVASHPGGRLRAALHGQNRPADQFLLGWARDFIAVLAPAGSGA